MKIKKMNANIEERDSRFELLRIVAMLMVLTLHYFNDVMGGGLSNITEESSNYYIMHLLESACIIAVNLFVLISGYFLINKNSISLKKVYSLIAICLFYGIVIFGTVVLNGNVEINRETIKTFIDTIVNRWFIVIYIILYLLSPYINELVKSITKNQLRNLILVMLFFFSIWPTIFGTLKMNVLTVQDNGYGIINFVMLYLIGGYIRLYKNDTKGSFFGMLIYLVMTLVTTVFSFKSAVAWAYNSIFNIISAIAFFMLFKRINIQSKWINRLAKYTLSVYIIHENIFIVKYVYQNIFNTPNYYHSKLLPIHLIITVLTIYIICVIIDVVRKFIFSKTIDKILSIKCIDKKIIL